MTATNMHDLVDVAGGEVSQRIFFDEDIYRRELERVFSRCWLYLCHESELVRPGEYVATYMGEDPVLVVRQRDGAVRAFLNACRHRGMRVCRADAGSARSFTCSYHGWTYGLDGTLVGVPSLKSAYHDELDRTRWGLIEVPKVALYKGLVFGTFEACGPSLVEYLGDMAHYLDVIVDRVDGGTEVIPGVHKWRMRGNWKLAAEQFGGDLYHTQTTHVSAMVAEVDPDDPPNYVTSESAIPRRQVAPGNGHAAGLASLDLNPRLHGPEILRYFQDTAAEAERRLGRERAHEAFFTSGNVFPNFSWLAQPTTIRVWHPRGPGAMEAWSWCLVEKKMPPAVKDAIRLVVLRHFSPAGTFEQDDGENFNYCAGASGGHISSTHQLNYQMGLGRSGAEPGWPGSVADFFSEQNQREFYGFWARCMTADSWAELSKDAEHHD